MLWFEFICSIICIIIIIVLYNIYSDYEKKIDDISKFFLSNLDRYNSIPDKHFEVETTNLKINTWNHQHLIDYIIIHQIDEITATLALYDEFVDWWTVNSEDLISKTKAKADTQASSMLFLGKKYLTKTNNNLSELEKKYTPKNIQFVLTTYTVHYNKKNYNDSYNSDLSFIKIIQAKDLDERVKFLSQYNYEMTEYQYNCSNQRKLMTPDLRSQIIQRDNGICQICKKKCQPSEIEIDHIIPVSKGGKTCVGNLQVLCSNCNRSKSNKLITYFPQNSFYPSTQFVTKNIYSTKPKTIAKVNLSYHNNNNSPKGKIFIPNTDAVVKIGDTVKILYLKDNYEISLKLVVSYQNDIKEGVTTISSPVGKALLEHKKNDIIHINIQGETEEIKILEIIKNIN